MFGILVVNCVLCHIRKLDLATQTSFLSIVSLTVVQIPKTVIYVEWKYGVHCN